MNNANVLNWFSGKGKEKAALALQLVAESVAQGYWVPGASRKVRAVLSKANVARNFGIKHGYIIESLKVGYEVPSRSGYGTRDAAYETASALASALKYADYYRVQKVDFDLLRKAAGDNDELRSIVETGARYAADHAELVRALNELDAQRPAPVFTQLGVSRTVTKTLAEMGLVGTVAETSRVCPTKRIQIEATDANGKVVLDKKTGKPVLIWVRVWDFPANTVFGESRFHIYNGQCEACGHGIRNPMNWLPVLIDDKAGVPHAVWTGTDCARNVFGIKSSKLSESDLLKVVPANEGK